LYFISSSGCATRPTASPWALIERAALKTFARPDCRKFRGSARTASEPCSAILAPEKQSSGQACLIWPRSPQLMRRRPQRYMRFSTSQRLNKREAIMIIQRQEDVTRAVTEAFKNTQPPRLREILMSFVKHLHAFARDVHLTEEEFEKAVQYIVKLGQKTDEKHNE